MRGWGASIDGGGGGRGMPPGGPMAGRGAPAISGGGGGGGGCAMGGTACIWNWVGIRGGGAIPEGRSQRTHSITPGATCNGK